MSYKSADNYDDVSDIDAYADMRRERRKNATHCFVVILSYYKYADVNFSYLYGDDDLRDFLIHELLEYYERVEDGEPLPKLSVEQMKAMDLDTLCSHAAIQGKYRIDNEIQWAIRAIIRVPGRPETIVDDRTEEAFVRNGRQIGGKRKRSDSETESESDEEKEP